MKRNTLAYSDIVAASETKEIKFYVIFTLGQCYKTFYSCSLNVCNKLECSALANAFSILQVYVNYCRKKFDNIAQYA